MRTATSLRSFLRLALSSHDPDYTEGSIGRAVVLLSIPMVLAASVMISIPGILFAREI